MLFKKHEADLQTKIPHAREEIHELNAQDLQFEEDRMVATMYGDMLEAKCSLYSY